MHWGFCTSVASLHVIVSYSAPSIDRVHEPIMPSKTFAVPLHFKVGIPACALLYLAVQMNGGLNPFAMASLKVTPMALFLVLVDKIATSGDRQHSNFSRAITLGLGLSTVGDVLLELEPFVPHAEQEVFFLGGLGAFLMAHWSYVVAFALDISTFNVSAAIISYIFAVGFFYLLNSHGLPDALQIPVAFYAFSIATMLWFACRRLGSTKTTQGSQRNGMLGAIFFVVSDAVLGFDKFANSIPHGKLLVMVTYYAAQASIALSVNGLDHDALAGVTISDLKEKKDGNSKGKKD